MNFLLKFFATAVIITSFIIPNFGCAKKVPLIEGQAQIDFKWGPHFKRTKTRWLETAGIVVNRGAKRADWVKVTVYSIDKRTGVVIDKTSQYIDGSGPHGNSVEPGGEAPFTIRLNSKKNAPYTYERDVTWVDAP